MRQSEAINELAAALAKAQAKIEGAAKESENPHFRNKYADLGNVWAAIREPLTSNGLSVVQLLRGVERGVECETILMHTTGQFIAESLFMPASKNDAQGYGSAATYARRYSLMAMVGIAPVDDDGEGSKDKGDTRRDSAPRQTGKPATQGTPLRDAHREITEGTASTVPQGGGKGAAPALADDPRGWVGSPAATEFTRKARDDLGGIHTMEAYSAWEKANSAELNAHDDYGAEFPAGKSGLTRKQFMDKILNETYDRIKAQAPNLRAAG